MRDLALSGQRDAARRQYEICRQIIARELGGKPAKETTSLYERICAGDLQAA